MKAHATRLSLGALLLTLVLAPLLLTLTASPATAQQRRQLTDEERARMMAEAQAQVERDMALERPIAALNTVWIDEMTWMEVRDALAEGKTTAIISTGGIEQNGPYLATGKHNYVLQGACEGIAQTLGNALCAPVIKLVPEGGIAEPSGHMLYPGTISLRQETFEALLTDVVSSLAAHGFQNIVLIGDSGGNQRGMSNVATALDGSWDGTRVHYVPEFYEYQKAFEYMEEELGITEPTNDGLHDDFVITSMMMTQDPSSVRYEQRVKAGLATINGLSIEDLDATVEIGRKLLDFRVNYTVDAIRAAIGG